MRADQVLCLACGICSAHCLSSHLSPSIVANIKPGSIVCCNLNDELSSSRGFAVLTDKAADMAGDPTTMMLQLHN